MFRFKRITSRTNGFVSSPKKDNLDSPAKRYELETSSIPVKRLRSTTPIKRTLLLSMPSPSRPSIENPSEILVEALVESENRALAPIEEVSKNLALNGDLKRELADLNRNIDSQHETIRTVLADLTEIDTAQFTADDLKHIVTIGQNEIRNLLNSIYNPGNELAKRAEFIIEESKKAHEKKFQKISFELNHNIEKTHSLIKRRVEELEHEMELHQRTLMTVEIQRKSEEKCIVNDNPKEEEKAGEKDEEISEPSEPQKANEVSTLEDAEEECVIIDDHGRASTPSPLKDVGNNTELTDISKEEKPSGASEDDEATDIEDSKDDERPFTPCQAQRQTD